MKESTSVETQEWQSIMIPRHGRLGPLLGEQATICQSRQAFSLFLQQAATSTILCRRGGDDGSQGRRDQTRHHDEVHDAW